MVMRGIEGGAARVLVLAEFPVGVFDTFEPRKTIVRVLLGGNYAGVGGVGQRGADQTPHRIVRLLLEHLGPTEAFRAGTNDLASVVVLGGDVSASCALCAPLFDVDRNPRFDVADRGVDARGRAIRKRRD